MSDKIALLRAFFRKRDLSYDVNMKKAQRDEIRAKRLALISELKLDEMSFRGLKDFIEERLCHNPLYPEHNYKLCLCASCHPVGYCIDDPCAVCEGPVTKCEPPDDEETDTEEEKEED